MTGERRETALANVSSQIDHSGADETDHSDVPPTTPNARPVFFNSISAPPCS